MARRFGFGLERKSAVTPSVLDARAYFLEMLPTLNEHTVTSLFATSYQPFSEFLNSSQAAIASIKDEIEKDPDTTEVATSVAAEFNTEIAIKILTLGWYALQDVDGAESLCCSLKEWAQQQNLTDDWCVDHAIGTLREYYLRLPGYSYLDAWRAACVNLRLDALCNHHADIYEVGEAGLHQFHFQLKQVNFTFASPLESSTARFKSEVLQKFESFVKGAREALLSEMDLYLDRLAAITEGMELSEPPIRWAEDHFKWLVEYQVNGTAIQQLARSYLGDVDKRVVIRDGIRNAAQLIGLECALERLRRSQNKVAAQREKQRKRLMSS